MNPYQQPYGPPGYGMPPANNYNYYGSGYQGYGGMPPPYTMQSGTGYPAPSLQQESSFTGYPAGYYNAPLPYGTTPAYAAYPQVSYAGQPYNPYIQTSTGYNPYPGQYDQSGQPVSTVGDNNSYPASTMSYGYPSGSPYAVTSSCPTSDASSGYPMPSTSSYDPYTSISNSYSNQGSTTTVTDSNSASYKADSPLTPTAPYGESQDEKSRWCDDPLTDAQAQRASGNNDWHSSSSDALPTPRPRGRANTPTGEMGDRTPGKERRDEQPSESTRGVTRQTTADEWNEIAEIINEDKVKGQSDDRHMDPKQLSGIAEDDPVARADYKRKLNALASLMTDVNLDAPRK